MNFVSDEHYELLGELRTPNPDLLPASKLHKESRSSPL